MVVNDTLFLALISLLAVLIPAYLSYKLWKVGPKPYPQPYQEKLQLAYDELQRLLPNIWMFMLKAGKAPKKDGEFIPFFSEQELTEQFERIEEFIAKSHYIRPEDSQLAIRYMERMLFARKSISEFETRFSAYTEASNAEVRRMVKEFADQVARANGSHIAAAGAEGIDETSGSGTRLRLIDLSERLLRRITSIFNALRNSFIELRAHWLSMAAKNAGSTLFNPVACRFWMILVVLLHSQSGQALKGICEMGATLRAVAYLYKDMETSFRKVVSGRI